jgi:ribosomal protection tetracycline resistance protein
VDRLLDIMNKYCEVSENGDDKQSDMSARVYKISRDDKGERLTHIKVTGGSLKAKQLINGEKINQIRIYSGEKYTSVNEAVCGSICAITGLEGTYAGQALGRENNDNAPVLSPVLNYKINLPAGTDPLMMLPKLKMIEEEEPQLHIEWNESFKEIHVQVMGPVMIEVLQNIIKERFDCDVTFSEGSIVYKETIADKVEGIGHFEPLRHYAEVHLILEPGEAGSGMQYELDCSEDMLAKNWQRLIYTHLCEKTHKGVLTGSALTDVKITVVAGRAHNKHTEGGDFRQATYRAVRNGLMQAESVLLEPFYEFTLILDRQYIGRAMTDFERMGAQFEINDNGDEAVIKGAGPVATVGNYQAEVNAYTRGKGVLRLKMSGYRPCHNTDEVIEQIGYEAERDTRNPADSVFCAHGSGFNVPWYEVKDYAHVDSVLNPVGTNENVVLTPKEAARTVSDEWIGTDEVDRILAQTYFANSRGDNERRKMSKRKASDEMGRYVTASGSGSYNNGQYKASQSKKQTNSISYLLVDGYNIIHAWSELEELSRINMDSARDKLLDIMCNYQGMKKCELIVVFDAYRVSGHHEEYMDYHNIHVVYTKEAETADHYIEKFAHENGKKYNITVATSDGLEQVIIRGAGCLLYSAREFEKEVKAMEEHIRSDYLNRTY